MKGTRSLNNDEIRRISELLSLQIGDVYQKSGRPVTHLRAIIQKRIA